MKYFKPIKTLEDILQAKEDIRTIPFTVIEPGTDKKGRTLYRLKKDTFSLGIIVLMNFKLKTELETALIRRTL